VAENAFACLTVSDGVLAFDALDNGGEEAIAAWALIDLLSSEVQTLTASTGILA
jgi:hypothetical protein